MFYLRYHGYSAYFPLWALARYRNLVRQQRPHGAPRHVRPLGVVVGYRAEARGLGALISRVVCSGADPDRARTAARGLCGEGVAGLGRTSVSRAGWRRHLRPGDLLLPEAVILPDGRRTSRPILPGAAGCRG